MSEEERRAALQQRIAEQEARKLKAQRQVHRGIWFGLGTFGLIGWSVATPTLLGTALGMWLDHRFTGRGVGHYSWTLTLLVGGLMLGCWHAVYWMLREHREIDDEDRGAASDETRDKER